ncbi:MAG: threonylcarbamoyl-AMP synthase [Candidatus Levybacteria bacterium RIFCSPHIGHO2_02_FULL_40_18]|nr:MAG: threonylcarbamoyl-AMP synthase [Candidatus Levybacteria bacterium RIFCSPHIGHO2_01_FULL_40_58]OGH26463.1 MAG: threonylcarbamoyl-AMP synthase [Candidatus Levybacteria bacterium RIFCSPHIGHO2_02_FULL_40_18]OGH31911.1 MAG: threonylcarbamoyl-AMP synthase [Candidatus Levybacteria bacterium RIFCSPHIGHO2_12_FULL_40_31]OGH40180.1 MAG: threonylcarbamoyl-AMP synthase [Candidatus Levybacteria bacterium RIFCSPLOWO2_01_FULL_40_64]OGH49304.1 MAG: threonylcarbamoyl-AMP synthase [Candidatus Levybacteria 
MNKNLLKALETVKKGGIIIFPTDTAFGIGCRVDDEKTVERLFQIRKRPKEKAVPVLASSINMVEDYVEYIKPDVRKLMGKYWPGALTLVLPAKVERVSNLIRGGGKTIGIRIPDHDSILRVIRAVGVPILGPSANLAGEKTPFKMSDLDPNLVRLVDFVLHGRCKIKKPSTVLDVSKKPWKVIRQGAVRLTK